MIVPKDVQTTQTVNGHRRRIVYNLSPIGHEPLADFVRFSQDRDVPILAVTSLNVSGEPEYSDISQVREFCARHGAALPLILKDPLPLRAGIVGSLPQFDLTTGTLVREGHVPTELLNLLLTQGIELKDAENMLGLETVDRSAYQAGITAPSKYEPFHFDANDPSHQMQFEVGNIPSIRRAILDFMHANG